MNVIWSRSFSFHGKPRVAQQANVTRITKITESIPKTRQARAKLGVSFTKARFSIWN